MSHKDKNLLPRERSGSGRIPVVPNTGLPGSSGAWFGSRTDILRKDADFLDAHAAMLLGKAKQARAMRDVIDARIDLARALGRLASLDGLIAHDVRLMTLRQATEETIAETELLQARQLRDRFRPEVNPPTGATSQLSVSDIDEVIARLPEVSDETRQTIAMLLAGRLKETR